ncbi:MAG TPA: hypothetical protein VLX61_11375 [Anaerolineales bacterium]|nr:hypothetical protein [Anaerolineales bacterium]
MKIRRFVLSLFIGIFILASLVVIMPQDMVVRAGCEVADCPTPTKPASGGGGGKTGPIPIRATSTLTPTPTQPAPNAAVAPVNPGLATPTATTPPWQAT